MAARLRTRPSLRALALAVSFVAIAACKDDPKPQGTPPPPPPPSASAQGGACLTGGGTVTDPPSAPFFSRTVAGYCVDPHADTKSFGDKGKLGIKELCNTALDGGCEEYRGFGVTRAVIVRYVDGSGPASVEAMLTQFEGDGAYTIFTTRLTADLDPADPSAMKLLQTGAGLGAMGTGKAYVQRGAYFLELTYANDQETPEQLKKSSDVILTALAKDIGAKLPDGALPVSARALPEAERLANGVLYAQKDALGIANAGAGAVGFYQDGTKRYRLYAAQREDADQAKDTFKTLKAKPGSMPMKDLGDEAAVVVLDGNDGGPKVEWVFVRKGNLVVGVGDEPRVFKVGVPLDRQTDVRLSKDEKIAKVRALLK
ncbi:hypothetical protein BH09MYX1_BH09MYX1_12390 [soil metagenome]